MPYELQIDGWGLTPEVSNAKEFLELRRPNLKITSVHWALVRCDIYPELTPVLQQIHTPILIWLN